MQKLFLMYSNQDYVENSDNMFLTNSTKGLYDE